MSKKTGLQSDPFDHLVSVGEERDQKARTRQKAKAVASSSAAIDEDPFEVTSFRMRRSTLQKLRLRKAIDGTSIQEQIDELLAIGFKMKSEHYPAMPTKS